MPDSGDVVRRITISATGEGIDNTKDSVSALGDAFDSTSQKAGDAQSTLGNMILSIAGVTTHRSSSRRQLI